jgi:ribonucleoside-triphosphate reductase
MIKHPESMRFCGFQNVTINLPQAAYRAGKGNWEGFKAEVFKGMDLALKAHLQKKDFIGKLMSGPSMPLWEIGKKAKDGKPYVDLEKCTYIIGLIGLNEAMQFMTGRELHESDAVLLEGMKIISHMQNQTKNYTAKHGLKFTLEESPAESASRRLAKIDYRDWPESRQFLRGDAARDEVYYTNSIHLRPDAPVDLMTRIEKQAKFHVMIESGAIIHAFVGEERPPAESIMALVRKTLEKTKAAQLTISPEFTICNDCNRVTGRLQETCGHCESTNVYGMTRIVGYFSRVNNWNKSKLGELKDRHKGNYGVAAAMAPAAAPVEAVATPAPAPSAASLTIAATAAAGA